jgi:hypothetical protein
VRAVGKLVVEVSGGVSDDTNGEVKTGDGLGRDVVGGWREGAGGGDSIGGAELATIEEKKETEVTISRGQGRAPKHFRYFD